MGGIDHFKELERIKKTPDKLPEVYIEGDSGSRGGKLMELLFAQNMGGFRKERNAKEMSTSFIEILSLKDNSSIQDGLMNFIRDYDLSAEEFHKLIQGVRKLREKLDDNPKLND